MAIALVIIALVFVTALGLHAYKRMMESREARMTENEYNTAVTLWNYARLVKSQIDEAARQGTGVIDFYKITVPHSSGYKMSLELISHSFRIYAIPDRYNRTGRLSFYTDSTITVRASDRSGGRATANDQEYAGTPNL
ncbi:MAG: hypothetical protein L0229_12995 [Blastocatellia bacterium]|nr:hypothetical protein [Blastocatellia bacterium]